MRIVGSNIKMASKHSMTQAYSRSEYLRIWDYRRGRASPEESLESSAETPANNTANNIEDLLELSPYAQAFIESSKRNPLRKLDYNRLDSLLKDHIKQEEIKSDKMENKIKILKKDFQKILIIEKLISAMTGKEIKLKIPDYSGEEPEVETTPVPAGETIENPSPTRPAREGWGVDYRFEEVYQETEKLTFSAEGIIKTGDGRELNFSVDLFMSREFMVKNSLSIQAGDAKIVDPIVINYSGPAADITETKFTFDLDADGNTEEIPFVKSGSGFLALDKNQDGIVNNGTELFGPSTGNGFLELQEYDADNNGWLDENDPIYENLRIWTKDADGGDRLFALGQVGVGAIYLGNMEAAFTYKGAANETTAINRSAGIFVRENGTVGTIQQIDLAL